MTEIKDEIWIYAPDGTLLKPALPVTSFTWDLEENKFGKVVVTGPSDEIKPAWFACNTRFEIHRILNGRPLSIEGGTQFLLRYWDFGENENGSFYTAEAYTPDYILTGYHVDSYASVEDNTNPLTTKSGYVDNVVKAFIRENSGSLTALAARKIEELVVEADGSLGPTVYKSAAWTNLYNVVYDLASDAAAKGTYISFGLLLDENRLSARVWVGCRGKDRGSNSGQTINISKSAGNLKNPKLSYDYRTECTAVRALGAGEGSVRATVRVEDELRSLRDPFSYREAKVENTQALLTDTLTSEANAALQQGRPTRTFTGKFVDTDTARYGDKVNYGDIVAAEYLGIAFNCRLYKVHGKFSKPASEELDIDLEGSSYL